MSKYLKIFLLAMLVVTMLASTVMAGVTITSHAAYNTQYTAALEAMGSARNVILLGAANGPITYVTTQNLTSGNFLQVSFTGASFSGNTVRVCRANESVAGGNQLGIATPSENTTSFNFQLVWANNDLGAGNTIYLTTEAACNNGGNGSNFIVKLSPTTTASEPIVTIGIVSSGNIAVDTASAGNLARIRSEYAAALNVASNATVDYLNTPGDGTSLVQGNAGSNSYSIAIGALNVTKQNLNLGAVNSAAGHNAGLTVGTNISVSDSLNWQGIRKVYLQRGNIVPNCADNAAGNIVGIANPTGTINLVVPAASFNASGANNYSLCLIADGNVLSQPRTFTATPKMNISGNGAQDQTAGSSATLHTWDTNAYQGFITWSVNSSAVPSYCLIGNNSTSKSANVIVNVTSSEDGLVINGQLGTIPAKTSKMLTFSKNSISLPGGTPLDITSIGADKRYVTNITVTGNPANITATCIQTDPVNGGKRAVPVLTNSDWRQ